MSRDKSSTSTHPQIKIGDRFGRWTVIGRFDSVRGKPRWLCRCDCGKEKPVYGRYLLKGNSTSCGCYARELTVARNTVHGHNVRGKRSTEYNSWVGMRERCLNENNPEWENYGGRGIGVCERWQDSFESFLADMGPKPTAKHQIDRMNNDGHYEPGNCRWATPQQNMSNQRKTVFLQHDGKRFTQAEWSRITGLSPATICERRAKGWSDSEVLTRTATPGRKAR